MTQRTTPAKGLPRAFQKGGGNPSGQPPKRASAVLRDLLVEVPSELDRKRMAEALGLASYEDVPAEWEGGTVGALWWMRVRQAYAGDEGAIADILERSNPKPRRMEVSGPNGGPLRSQISQGPPTEAEVDSGAAFYAALAGEDDELDE